MKMARPKIILLLVIYCYISLCLRRRKVNTNLPVVAERAAGDVMPEVVVVAVAVLALAAAAAGALNNVEEVSSG